MSDADSQRLHQSFTAQSEKQLLRSIAARLPQWVVPDHLTLLGVLGAGVTFGSLIAAHAWTGFMWIAVFGIFINWFGDSLDGTLARLRSIERPRYGFFVDHVSDIAAQFLIVLGLGLSPFMQLEIATLALLGYLALSIYTFVKLHVTRSMQISYLGVGPTEVRLLIVTGIVAVTAMDLPTLELGTLGAFSIMDLGGLIVFAFAIGTCLAFFRYDLHRLAQIDPPRHTPPTEIPVIEIGHQGG